MINLLPEEYKNRIKNKKKWNDFLFLEIIILFLCIFAMVGMIGIKAYFDMENKYAINMLEAYKDKNATSQAIALEIKNINLEVDRINNIIAKQQQPSDFFLKVSGALEKGMNLKSFSYKYKDNGAEISLAGYAPDNNALSKFQDNLEDIFKSKINIPLDALAKRNEIDFSFSFSILNTKNDNK